ncbi:MAG: HAD family phosphatase [Actinomycetales bacterium]|nr:HAD family phosphatase [Actinomycetales bacterium]
MVLTDRLAAPGASLLLDLDGTLIDSEPASRAAYRAFFGRRGWAVDDDVLRLFAGRRATDVFASVPGPWTGHDHHHLARESLSLIDHDAHPPVPVPGARDLLRHYSGRLPIAIVTSASLRWVERALAIIGAEMVDTVVSAETSVEGKPSPAPYRLACERLGVDPRAALACEDTPSGIRAARAAGVGAVLGVTTSLPASVLADAGATHVSASLEVLLVGRSA